jgi:hypothetical protein
MKCTPGQWRLGQSAIGRVDIEPDRPEFVVMRLAHLHFRHPEKNLAGIEIAENPLLEFQEKWRVKRIAEIQQDVWTGQPLTKLAPGHTQTAHLIKIVDVVRMRLKEQAISTAQPMFSQAPLEIAGSSFVGSSVPGGREQFEPDGVQTQTA